MQPVSVHALGVDFVHGVLCFLKLTRANLLAVRAVSQFWESCAECFLPWHTFLPLSADGLLKVFACDVSGPIIWVDVRGCAGANIFQDQDKTIRRLLAKHQQMVFLTDTFADVSEGIRR